MPPLTLFRKRKCSRNPYENMYLYKMNVSESVMISGLLGYQLSHIEGHCVVGLALEGIEIGRGGELCWLQVGVHMDLVLSYIRLFLHLGQ